MESVLDRVLTLNLVATAAVFYVAARIYLSPRLDQLSARSVMIPILLLHSLRHLGLMFLTRGATYLGLPPQFAWPAALGDLVAAVLAFVSIPLVLRDWMKARPLVWIFNIWGTLDLLVAITLATVYRAPFSLQCNPWRRSVVRRARPPRGWPRYWSDGDGRPPRLPFENAEPRQATRGGAPGSFSKPRCG
ncbi:MAG: hypothetical protein L0Z50_28800 [Verrucomicrobiales bacterium]|nr:hypothetical protein [Verrucomicrobiales bacterium]